MTNLDPALAGRRRSSNVRLQRPRRSRAPSIVEVGKLTFDQAAAGSMQARFGDALCVMNPDLQ